VDTVIAPAPGLFVLDEIFARMQPNPTVQNMMDCAAFIARVEADAVVAIGGGSALDFAKAAAVGLPVIALPTTSGTGSEATCISVLTDDAGQKMPRTDPSYYPKAAIVDPNLTLSVPPGVTAATGMDALSHAVEALWSIHHSPASDALALRAAPRILQNIEKAYADPQNLSARVSLSEGSLLAALAFSQAKTAAAHACSFSLTMRYGLPHGTACAFTLPALCRVNAPAEDGRLHAIARELGFDGALAFADELDRLNAALGLPRTLGDAGIPLSDLPSLAQACVLPPNMRNNPVPMDAGAVEKLFLALSGE
jgi:alcohol dehydrogenase